MSGTFDFRAFPDAKPTVEFRQKDHRVVIGAKRPGTGSAATPNLHGERSPKIHSNAVIECVVLSFTAPLERTLLLRVHAIARVRFRKFDRHVDAYASLSCPRDW